MQGTVKRWLDLRGFGFIEPEDGGKDIFIHSSDIKGASELRQGQKVKFEVESSYKGPKAINLTIIE